MAKILIADDEPDIIQFCEFALREGKHTIVPAYSGPQTLEKLRKEKPDILILDIMLPGMDGYTIQLHMAQDETLSHIPVIVISALKPALGLFDKFEQVSTFLSKPFHAEDLVRAVDDILNSDRSMERKYRPYM